MKFNQLNFPLSRKIFLPLLLALALFSGYQAIAQLPSVEVQFVNPRFEGPMQYYCVDVEIKTDSPDQQLFGMNVRFFYDDAILEFLAVEDILPGYDMVSAPQKITGLAGSGVKFGFGGLAEWVNGKLQRLPNSSQDPLPANVWIKLFSVRLNVDMQNFHCEFCPSIVWDMQQNPPDMETGRGFLHGDDSVVLSLVDPDNVQNSLPTFENCHHLNWQYDNAGGNFGHPASEICIELNCIPLANWSLFLAIGLMLIVSVFIYRRRINS